MLPLHRQVLVVPTRDGKTGERDRSRCTYCHTHMSTPEKEEGQTHGMVSGDAIAARWSLPSSELSHSIFASAISHVSRTLRSESERYWRRIDMDDVDEIAPIASAACCT